MRSLPFELERLQGVFVLPRSLGTDIYHKLINARWSHLAAVIGLVYLGVTLSFAVAYLAVDGSVQGARHGSFTDHFFFSVHTLTTIGYGTMVPQGLYAGVLVTLEAFTGLIGIAMASALMFAKLSIPTAQVSYSREAVIGQRGEETCLMFRIANLRSTHLVDVRLQAVLIRDERIADGHVARTFHDLVLERSSLPQLHDVWTAIHVIGQHSPLYGQTSSSLEDSFASLHVTVTALDASLSQPIHACITYHMRDLIWGAGFVEVFHRNGAGDLQVDHSRFHHTRAESPVALRGRGGTP